MAVLLSVAPAAMLRAAEPLRIVDDEGTAVTLPAIPKRIISLSPATTEIVFALGAGDRLLAGSAWDDYPPEAAALPDVVTYNGGVVMEQVVELDPDLVLAGGNAFTPPADVARMRELGLTVLVVYAPDVPAVLADIELIGTAVGEPGAAAEISARMEADIKAITTAVAAMPTRPRTFYEIGAEPEIYAPAPDSFVADMVALAGGTPITTGDPAVWSIPLESLVIADPEVIVLGDANYGVCPDAVAARAGWSAMTAVASGAVYPVDEVAITRPGPRLAEGLASLARAIHPTIELPGLAAGPPPCTAG